MTESYTEPRGFVLFYDISAVSAVFSFFDPRGFPNFLIL